MICYFVSDIIILKLNKGGRTDEQRTNKKSLFLLLAVKYKNARRLGKMESNTQRQDKRRNAGSTSQSIQRHRMGTNKRHKISRKQKARR